jgi:hypothetical protein
MLSQAAAFKAYHVLIPAAVTGALAASGQSEIAAVYPDLRAFLIYACYGALGGAALGMWTVKFRTILKFLAVLFTGSVVAGFVGPAAAHYVGPAVSPLAAFLSALVSPALILDPFGTLHKVFDLLPKVHIGTGTQKAAVDTTHITDLIEEDEAHDLSGPKE